MGNSKKVIKMITTMLGIVVMLAILGTVFDLLQGGKDTGITFTASEITFSDADGNEIIIPYSDVISIELVDEPVYGAPTDGKLINDIRVGTWTSDTFGVHITHTSTKIIPCIVIKTAKNTYTVNYESDKTTTELVEELRKYI